MLKDPTTVAVKVAQFFSTYPEHAAPKGRVIIHAGERPAYIYYLLRGSVRQYDITDKGDEVVVTIFKPPAFFPMSYALTRIPSGFFFDTAEEIQFRQAPADAVVSFLRANADVTLDLLTRVYSGVEGLLLRQVAAMSGTAISRLSLELIVAARRFGKPFVGGTQLVGVTETELAARTGLTRETVSRCLSRLKKDDVVEVVHGGIVVKDIDLLHRNYHSTT